jgi:hypothetical protein
MRLKRTDPMMAVLESRSWEDIVEQEDSSDRTSRSRTVAVEGKIVEMWVSMVAVEGKIAAMWVGMVAVEGKIAAMWVGMVAVKDKMAAMWVGMVAV